MQVNSILPFGINVGSGADGKNEVSNGINSFKSIFNNAIKEVDALQKQSEAAKLQLATGQAPDIHSVMIASEKASLALQFTIQIRNKLLDAYHEIMRMQV